MAGLLVIEDSTIVSMARDPKFAGIPCVANQQALLAATTSSCGSCARKKLEGLRAALTKAKTCLAGLSPEKKAELKALLNVDLIRVIFKSATGQVSNITF
jgi:hypothetical protein